MLEYLDESKVHPSEFYITLPVKDHLSTGDLIILEGKRYVVLTPACDFAQRKVSRVFLLRIKNLSEEVSELNKVNNPADLSASKRTKLERLIKNSSSYFHFIPKHTGIDPGIIDFQDKVSVPYDEIEAKITNNEVIRFATISMPFLKDLVERYSSYYSRQGSPDFDSDEIITALLS